MESVKIAPASGKLGVLLPGLGAVASTFIAGVEAVRQGNALPIGSLSQLAHIRLGKRTEDRNPLIRELVPLAGLDALEFGGWDPIPDDAYETALKAGVLERSHIDPLKDFLTGIRPMPAVFDKEYVRRIDGTNVKNGANKYELGEQLREDIRNFAKTHGCERMVMVWCGSTEVFLKPGVAHETIASFEKAMRENDPAIAPSMVYAWAALKEGVPFANGAPNLTVDLPAIRQLARDMEMPVAGKDFKTGQTMMKTIIAPGLKARMLG
jgi:myo-inositol-1-phosphate synthase